MLLAVVLFLLAEITRVGWLFLFDAVLWGALVVSAVMPWVAVGPLHVMRRVFRWHGSDDIVGPMEGDAVEFEVGVRNNGRLPCMLATMAYNCGGRPVLPHKPRLFVAWLGKNQSLSTTTRVAYDRRGAHKLPRAVVETGLPFGLYRRSKRVGEATQVLVLPKVYPLDGLDTLGSLGNTDPVPVSARSGEQISGSRSYVQGNPFRHVHWRNTARTAEPQVKEFERASDNHVAIAVGRGRSQRDGDEALEHAIRVAASVGDFVCRSGGTVRLLAGRRALETSDRLELLRELALMADPGETSLAELLRQLPPWMDVLASVLEGDAPGIEALVGLMRDQRRVAAVVLRGFGPGSHFGSATHRLTAAGVTAIDCWPGRIHEAMAALEGTSHRPSPETSRSAVSG